MNYLLTYLLRLFKNRLAFWRGASRIPSDFRQRSLAAFFLAIIMIMIAGLLPLPATADPRENFSASTDLFGLRQNSSLPIHSVTIYEVPQAKGTAILIPQIHKSPGSGSTARTNDSAEIAQQEIYKIIFHLENEAGIEFVMVEGNLFGPVAEEKIQAVKKKMGGNPRDLILEGAAMLRKAEGANFALYGAENKETFEESADLVRSLVWINDRLKMISRGKTASAAFGQNAKVSPRLAKNPYLHITDVATLKRMQQNTERDMRRVVIDRRNRETAANFARGLAAEKKNLGILQFGAAHTSGLVEELQSQGLSVLVVTPQEVGMRKKDKAFLAPAKKGGPTMRTTPKTPEDKLQTRTGELRKSRILLLLRALQTKRL